jgi:methionine-rich copper-binding protein CopC
MKSIRIMGAAAIAALVATASPAIAHPRLVSSAPAAKAVASNVTKVTLVFSERLMPQMSGIDLAMTGMPGMANHAPMKVTGFRTTVAEDGKTLVVAFPKPLPAGSYKLDWHAVSADTHRITGSLIFSVR